MKAGRLGLIGVLALTTAMAPARTAPVPAPVLRTVDIVIHYSQFSPAQISLKAGTTVRFRLTNTDPIDHEFILGDAALQHHEEVGNDPIHDGMVPGMVSVPAGTTRYSVVAITAPPAGGQLIYGCHLPGHYAFGMRGILQITS